MDSTRVTRREFLQRTTSTALAFAGVSTSTHGANADGENLPYQPRNGVIAPTRRS